MTHLSATILLWLGGSHAQLPRTAHAGSNAYQTGSSMTLPQITRRMRLLGPSGDIRLTSQTKPTTRTGCILPMPSCLTKSIQVPGSRHAGEIRMLRSSQMTGTRIRADEVIRVEVNVTNSLHHNGTSIHWHVSVLLNFLFLVKTCF